MSRDRPTFLRWIASTLLRGPGASYVLGDLEEGLRRDVSGGLPSWKARLRYLSNLLRSAVSLYADSLGRSVRRLPPPQVSLLDLKLGFRMLIKYPVLTLVAVFALAVGIPAALTPLHVLSIFDAPLPFDEGERIVGLRHVYVTELEETPGSLHEYEVWSERLSGLEGIGAAHAALFNVRTESGILRPYRAARVTASTFDILRTPPLLGRPLMRPDQASGAPDVVVLGYEPWQTLFEGDPTLWVVRWPLEGPNTRWLG